LITAFIVFLSLGQNAPETTGLPYDRNAKNIATLFTMTNEDGRLENIQIMESIFKDGSLGFKSESHHNKSSKYIYERLESAAKEVGTYGTLLFYVNSHGGGSWKDFSMTAAGGDFKFSKALQAIAKGNKVKRLIIFIDTCHAEGGIQEGFQEGGKQILNIRTGLQELPSIYKVSDPDKFFDTEITINYGQDSGSYSEALILASTNVNTLSTRTIFPTKMKATLQKIKNEKTITVAQFLKKFAEAHNDVYQKPLYKVLPDDKILSEPLFANVVREITIFDRVENKKINLPSSYVILPSD
jgi:hypothetical protein